jgi:phage tail-like protein
MANANNFTPSTLATDPLRSFRFYAEFAPTGDAPFSTKIIRSGWVGGFQSINGLNISTQAIQYREGGYNTTVHQIPGMTTFQPVTFTRGVIVGNDQAITWMRGLFAAAAGEGLNGGSQGFRVNVKIYVQDHPMTAAGTVADKMVFEIHNAWIQNLSYTDLDATNGAILFESMQLIHEGLSVSFV